MNTKYPDNMSRDEFKANLFKWLKDRGILNELQAFLRQQMVQKLNGMSLSKAARHLQSPREQAFTLLICDYLKKQGLTFTLSVLAAEKRLPSHEVPSFNNNCLLEETLHCLKLGNITQDVQFSVQRDQRQSILEILFEQFEKLSSRSERRDATSQPRLQAALHAGVQARERRPELVSRSTQTETDETPNHESIVHEGEISLLKLRLQEMQTAYEESQERLRQTLQSLSQLASSTSVETLDPEKSTERARTRTDTSESSDFLRKAQTARSFLDSVDSKMSDVNERLRSLSSTNPLKTRSTAEFPSEVNFYFPYHTGASSDVFVSSGNALSADLYSNKNS